MRDIIKPGLILLIITVVAAVFLGFVNQVTFPIITANELETKNAAMARLLVDVKDNNFSEDYEITEPDSSLSVYNIGFDGTEPVGYVITANPKGYGGAIKLLVAIGADGEIKGIEIVKHSETPGLGANAKGPKFTDQFIGKSDILKVTKSTPSENEIQAITSATITSTAVTNGVNEALTYFKNNLQEAGK